MTGISLREPVADSVVGHVAFSILADVGTGETLGAGQFLRTWGNLQSSP